MKVFLKLKHWQIFLIWILGSIQLLVFINSGLWFISFGIYFGILFGWIYSIGKVLNNDDSWIIKRLNLWSIVYLISIIPFWITFHNMFSYSYRSLNDLFLIVGGILGFISIINIALISARSLKEKEKQKGLKFTDYFIEFLLILYMIIGIWILQPRLNEIIKKKNTTGNMQYSK